MKYPIRNIKKLKVIKFSEIMKTVTCIKQVYKKLPKYNRYILKKYKLHVHIPENYDISKIKIGKILEVGQTRRISKIKSHILV
jgi:ribosomal protein S17